MTVDQIIGEIIRREGSKFTNDPDDPGGPTRWGVTLATLKRFRKDNSLTAGDVEVLERDEAELIYRQLYFAGPRYDRLPAPLQPIMTDTGVNFGTSRATKWMQKVVFAKADGAIGPKTLGAVKANGWRRVHAGMMKERIKFRGRRVKANPSQLKWINGWLNRDLEFLDELV